MNKQLVGGVSKFRIRHKLQILIVIGISFILGLGIWQFNREIEAIFQQRTAVLLLETTENQKLLFETRLQTQVHTLEILAKQLSTEFISLATIVELLPTLVETSGFDSLGVIDANGDPYNSEIEFNVSERAYFQEAMTGKTVISQPIRLKSNDENGIVTVVPLWDGEAIIGLIYGVNILETLTFSVMSPSFSEASYGYIVDQNGLIIANMNTPEVPIYDNLFSLMDEVKINNQPLERTLADELKAQDQGFITYERDGKRLAYYQTLDFNDWLVIGVIPESEISTDTAIISTEMLWLVAKIALLVCALVLYIVEQNKNSQAIIQKQLEWTKMSEAKYRIALEQSDSLIFEYFVETNIFDFSKQILNTLNLEKGVNYTPEILGEQGLFVAEKEWLGVFAQIRRGVPSVAITVLVEIEGQPLQWYDIYLTTIFDSQHRPQRAVGKFVNIHAQREYTIQLIANAQKDSLTGLYNKRATEMKIGAIIKQNPDAYHGMFVIDIDDFKTVNDRFGHYLGDQVIYEVSQFLQAICRESDIVGRIGGDEFIIFLKDTHKPSIIEKKAAEICQAFKQYYLPEQEHKISGSVGAVIIEPGTITNFQQLYEHADTAMYQAKKSGKDQYKITKC